MGNDFLDIKVMALLSLSSTTREGIEGILDVSLVERLSEPDPFTGLYPSFTSYIFDGDSETFFSKVEFKKPKIDDDSKSTLSIELSEGLFVSWKEATSFNEGKTQEFSQYGRGRFIAVSYIVHGNKITFSKERNSDVVSKIVVNFNNG